MWDSHQERVGFKWPGADSPNPKRPCASFRSWSVSWKAQVHWLLSPITGATLLTGSSRREGGNASIRRKDSVSWRLIPSSLWREIRSRALTCDSSPSPSPSLEFRDQFKQEKCAEFLHLVWWGLHSFPLLLRVAEYLLGFPQVMG